MTRFRQSLPLLPGLILTPSTALANQPPGPQLMISEITILPIMVVMTLLGGGYAILKASGKRRRVVLRLLGAVLLIFLSGMHEGYGLLVVIFFALLASVRGLAMIRWAFQARKSPDARPPHLQRATPWRLAVAGTLLVVIAVMIAGYGTAHFGLVPQPSRAERALKELLVYQRTIARRAEATSGIVRYEAPTVSNGHLEFAHLSSELPSVAGGESRQLAGGYAADFSLGANGESFEIWVVPQRVSPFPYNYIDSFPSFYANESGEIRMARVHHARERCPEDSPVYYKIGPQDFDLARPPFEQ